MYRIYLLIIIVLSACTAENTKSGKYELLPIPTSFNIEGQSSLKGNDVTTIYFEGDINDMVLLGSLRDLSIVEDNTDAYVSCKIDSTIELKDEGYRH